MRGLDGGNGAGGGAHTRIVQPPARGPDRHAPGPGGPGPPGPGGPGLEHRPPAPGGRQGASTHGPHRQSHARPPSPPLHRRVRHAQLPSRRGRRPAIRNQLHRPQAHLISDPHPTRHIDHSSEPVMVQPPPDTTTALRPPARTYSVASSCQQALGAGQVEPAPGRPRSLGRLGPGHPLPTEEPGQPRRRGRLQAHGGHLVVHADRTVVQSRALQSRAHVQGLGAHRLGQTARAGIADGATGARPPPRAPPPARAGARRRTSCGRCPARRRTSSPPHGARHRATGRSPDGHGDQHCGTYRSSPLNPKPRVSPPGHPEVSPMS